MQRTLSAILIALSLTLAGCNDKDKAVAPPSPTALPTPPAAAFTNTDVTGLDYAKDFSLKDFNGKLRTMADFKGKAVIMFFGYTQCPDVCPTTMTDLAAVMKQLGPQADKVQVLFVTVDPERDTPEILSKYVPAFDPRFLGLRGDAAETTKIAKDYKVYYQKQPGKEPGSYSMDHSAGLYIYDTQGRIRLFARDAQDSAAMAHDLKILLSQQT
jgi:protein SCO1/2